MKKLNLNEKTSYNAMGVSKASALWMGMVGASVLLSTISGLIGGIVGNITNMYTSNQDNKTPQAYINSKQKTMIRLSPMAGRSTFGFWV